MTKYSFISKLFLFDGMDFSLLDDKYKIMSSVVSIEYEPGSIIQSSDIKPLGIGIITGGSAKIYSDSKSNSPLLRTLPLGGEFGVASLFSSGSYTTCVIADENCEASYISKKTLEMLFANETQISINYIKFLSGRISFLNQKLSTYTRTSAEDKLAYYLFECETDDEGNIAVNYSQLADVLNIGRASLYRSLDKLSSCGIIERTSKTIKIIDRNKLLENL